MKTQPRSEISILPRILMPSDFSLASPVPVRRDEGLETTVESMVNRLARNPFLAGMNRRHLALLAGWAKIAQFEKGQVIFHEGDLADRFHLIETGKVGLESSSGIRDPRSGWSWMFPPHIRTHTARAIEPVTAIFFYAPVLRDYCEKDHSFGYEFLKRMSLEMYRRQTARNKIPTVRRQSSTFPAVGAVAA